MWSMGKQPHRHTEMGQISSSCLLQNNDSMYKRYLNPVPRYSHGGLYPQSPSLKRKVSDSKVSRQEGIVPGRCEGQVGT